MKKIIIVIICSFVISISLTNCKKEEAPIKEKSTNTLSVEKVNPAKLNQLQMVLKEKKLSNTSNARSSIQTQSISYTRLCIGETYSGDAVPNSMFNTPQFDFYYFEGQAGDVVTIYAKRTGNCAMDPAFALFYGTTNDLTDVSYFNGGNNMTLLAFADDNISTTCGIVGCFSDPLLTEYVLPYTGKYTVAVFDFFSCGPGPLTYDLTISGIDPCSIIIDGCDSKVSNKLLPSGKFMLDEILASAYSAKNHGQFVSQVTKLTNAWRSAGLITGEEKGKIMSCVAGSKLGKK